ncbi:MAG: hypothetical protein H6537_03130 [Bacteroidales bacterium]|nr:hypothetical protein [Bacteroidales bacterium]
MDNKDPILHIGYPKTATKWFQSFFYPNISGVWPVSRETTFQKLVFKSLFEYSAVDTFAWFNSQYPEKQIIVCDEILLGGLDIGFGMGEYVWMMANRLHSTFPTANVVVFIRNQVQILESAYSHYVKSGGTYSLKKFLGIRKSYAKPFMGYHLFNPDFFNYSNVLELYMVLFGEEKVHIYLYEDFKANPKVFIEKFCQELNINADISDLHFSENLNVRLSKVSISIMRLLNHFTRKNTPFKKYFFHLKGMYEFTISLTGKLDRWMKLSPFTFSRSIVAWSENYYRTANNNLTKWVNKNKLEKYKYPL